MLNHFRQVLHTFGDFFLITLPISLRHLDALIKNSQATNMQSLKMNNSLFYQAKTILYFHNPHYWDVQNVLLIQAVLTNQMNWKKLEGPSWLKTYKSLPPYTVKAWVRSLVIGRHCWYRERFLFKGTQLYCVIDSRIVFFIILVFPIHLVVN